MNGSTSVQNIPDTVALDEREGTLVIIDQTKLPGRLELLRLKTTEEIAEAIRSLRVRGAPAIGVAASIGLYLAARNSRANSFEPFCLELKAAKDRLASSRPTAVNLFWALERMERVALSARSLPIADVKNCLKEEAETILEEDVRVCRAIGVHGLALLRDGQGILTHCNAGRLAAVRYGTALAPIYLGLEKGMRFHVYADETRPLLQGARLTAWELRAAGVDTTLICDSMAGQVMKNGWVQAVITGADRVAANGDCCNKIGTASLAILARHYGIPFYVCAPVSTIDMNLGTGAEIPIEQRQADEVTEMWYGQRIAPTDMEVYNPAFDVAEHNLVSAIVTERGVLYPPYESSLRGLFA